MNEHYPQEHPPAALAAGDAQREKVDDPVNEPDQRWQELQMQRLLRHERIRLFILGIGLLGLLAGFLLYSFAGTIFPLFATMVVTYLGYRRIGAWLDAHEPPL